MSTRALAALALAPVLACTITACSTNPATGRSQLDLLSPEQEVAIGQEATPQLIQEFGGEIPSPQVQAYVEEVGRSIVPAVESEYAGVPWEFHTVNSPIINAFALPGGKVFVSRGMLEAMTNEAQLAAVLGHEMGHVTARHVNERYSQQLGVGIGGSIIGAVLGDGGTSSQIVGAATQLGADLALKSFSRDQELEADELGMRYMSRAGYDPRGMLQMMQVLESKGASGGAEFFSTHPNPSTRIEDINDMLADQHSGGGGRLEPDRYRQRALAPLAQLPPAPGAQQGRAPARLMERYALTPAGAYCLHCAAGVEH